MIFKMKKSWLLSALLAIAMAVSFIPVTAFAADPLILQSAEVTSDGGVGLTFNKELSTADIVNKVKNGFTITGLEDMTKTITNVTIHSVSGGTNNFVQLYLNPTVKGGEAASLSYTPGDVQAADGGMLAEISSMDIENNLPHPELVTTAPPAATAGSAYTHTLTVSGGTGPYTFSVVGGSLPSGLTMSSTGVISGTPTVAANFTFYIMVQDTNQAFDIEGFNITVNPSDKVCEIDGTQYTTLDDALAAISPGETKTITLLKNIDYNKGIFLENKTVTFALNGYTLNINNPAEGGSGLAVQQGGAVFLSGAGALNATGETYGVRVSTSALPTQATVTNATATGPTGEAAYAAGSVITVLNDATVTGNNAIGAHAISDAMIDIKGNVNATNQGAYASDSTIKVAGNVIANGTDLLGDATGIGVNVYGAAGTVEIGGNVTANKIGAKARAGGSITIDGTLTAPAYIQFADDVTTTIDGYLATTTKPGYRTYQHETAGTVWIKGEMPATTHTITVQNDGNGTASADFNSAAEGAEITLDAVPNSGYRFKEWQVISGGVTIVNNKFNMQDSDVTIKAFFEPIPASIHIVTFILNGGIRTGGGDLTQTVPDGGGATAPIITRNNYTFTGWDKDFSNVTSDMTVTAGWSCNGGSGSGSGSGGNSSSYNNTATPAAAASEKKPGQPVTAAVFVTATAGENGAASVSSPDKAIADAIAKAQAEAKTQGDTANGILAEMNVAMPHGATSLTMTLTQNVLNSLVNSGISRFELNGAPVSLTLDLNAIKEIQKQSGSNISITIAPATDISAQARDFIGDRPVYNIDISCVKDGKTITVSSLGSGRAIISIPYTPDKNEAVAYLFGVYVDANGNAIRIDGSAYDSGSGSMIIPAGHFSVYGVGYTAPSAKFIDIGNHWGRESIDYIVGRGLLSGTSETTFAPNEAMTRGMLVTALGRLAEADTKAYNTSSFTDVKADNIFCPYIEWAYKKGIVQGIGNQRFAPDRAITREEIAVIFANYAKVTGCKLPATCEKIAYADASDINGVYKTAVTAMQQAGIMIGDTDNKFNPKANATRAEVSSMLHRYIKAVID